jgi:voltage-gated potassium channel
LPFGAYLLLLVIKFFYTSFRHIYETDFEVLTLKDFFPGGIKYLEDTPFLSIPLFFYFTYLVYALVYMFLGNELGDSFLDKSKISFDEAEYFSLTALTVGPDGLTPNSNLVRKIVMSEIVVGLLYAILIFSSIGSLLQQKRDRTAK